MDIKQIRIENLLTLIEEFGGSREKFAELLGYQDVNYLNQLVRGHGSFGGKTAKKISLKLGKDAGWLDRIHKPEKLSSEAGSGDFSEIEKEYLDMFRQLNDEDKNRILAAGLTFIASAKNR